MNNEESKKTHIANRREPSVADKSDIKSDNDDMMVIHLYNTIGSDKKRIKIRMKPTTPIRVLKRKIAEYYGDLDVNDFELSYVGSGEGINYMKIKESEKLPKKKKLKRVKTGDKILDNEIPDRDLQLDKQRNRETDRKSNDQDRKIMTANRREPSIDKSANKSPSGKIVINLQNTVGPTEGKKNKLRITLPENTPIKVIKEKIADYYGIDVDEFELAHMGKSK